MAARRTPNSSSPGTGHASGAEFEPGKPVCASGVSRRGRPGGCPSPLQQLPLSEHHPRQWPNSRTLGNNHHEDGQSRSHRNRRGLHRHRGLSYCELPSIKDPKTLCEQSEGSTASNPPRNQSRRCESHHYLPGSDRRVQVDRGHEESSERRCEEDRRQKGESCFLMDFSVLSDRLAHLTDDPDSMKRDNIRGRFQPVEPRLRACPGHKSSGTPSSTGGLPSAEMGENG